MVTSNNDCTSIHPDFAFCVPNTEKVLPKVPNASPRYKQFLANILHHATPYEGKKVFVVVSGGRYKLVCPTYKIHLAKRWYSLSVASNGFMYLHLLRNHVPYMHDCVYSGAHVTIGPHMKSNTHLHFHITNIDVTIKDGKLHATKDNRSICSVAFNNIDLAVSQKQRFADLTCIQDGMTLRDIVWDGVRFDEIDDTLSMLLSLVKKGTSPHSSSKPASAS